MKSGMSCPQRCISRFRKQSRIRTNSISICKSPVILDLFVNKNRAPTNIHFAQVIAD